MLVAKVGDITLRPINEFIIIFEKSSLLNKKKNLLFLYSVEQGYVDYYIVDYYYTESDDLDWGVS